MITNQQLREAFLPPQMKYYFNHKLAPLPSDEVDARIEEALKFLHLAAHGCGSIPVSEEIDEIWHYWILETAEYQKLCAKLPSGKMIHHSGNDYLSYADKELKVLRVSLADGVAILSSYVKNFGPFAADRVKYWRLPPLIMQRKNWTVDKLNHWLISAPAPTTTASA